MIYWNIYVVVKIKDEIWKEIVNGQNPLLRQGIFYRL